MQIIRVIQRRNLGLYIVRVWQWCCFVLLLWSLLPSLNASAASDLRIEPDRVNSAIVQYRDRFDEKLTLTQARPEHSSAKFTAKDSSSRSAMPPDINRILKRGTLVVALLDQENPPFFMTDTAGQLTGLDIQLARDLADQLGVDVAFNRSAKSFDQVVQTVYRLDADLAISKLSRTLSRAKTVRFTQPYATMRQGLLVNRLQIAQQANGRSVTEVIRNLHGKVGVLQGSSYVGFTRKKFPNAQVVEFPTWSAVVDAVMRGEVLATYRDELEVKKIILSKPDAALQFQTIALTDTQDALAITLPWDSQHLLAFVNQYLETTQTQHTADSLLKLYAESLK